MKRRTCVVCMVLFSMMFQLGLAQAQDVKTATKRDTMAISVDPRVVSWSLSLEEDDERELDMRLKSSFGLFLYDGWEVSLLIDLQRTSSESTFQILGSELVRSSTGFAYGTGVQVRPYIALSNPKMFVRPVLAFRYQWIDASVGFDGDTSTEIDGAVFNVEFGASLGYMLTARFGATVGLNANYISLSVEDESEASIQVVPDIQLTWMF